MSISEIRGAVARGWCSQENTHKEMDVVLAEAIVREIVLLIAKQGGKAGGMNMKEVSTQPVTQLIATFTACKQVGPENWDVYPVSQLFAASATIADIAAWFHKQNPKVTKIENIHLHQPEECDKAQQGGKVEV